MNKKLRQALKTIILAAVLYVIAICLPAGWGKDVFMLWLMSFPVLPLSKNLCAIFAMVIFLMKIS